MATENTRNFEKALTDDERVELFLSRHWKKLLAAVLLVLIVFIVGYTIYNNKQQKIKDATIALANAKVEQLPALLIEYPDVPGAAFARLRLASHQVSEKKYQDAAANFIIFSQTPAVPVELALAARLSAAACKENLGENKEALNIYLAVFNDQAASAIIRNEAAFNCARLYIAGNEKAKAAELLKGIVENQNTPADFWKELCQNLYDTVK